MLTEANKGNEGLTTDFSDDTDEGVGGSTGSASGEWRVASGGWAGAGREGEILTEGNKGNEGLTTDFPDDTDEGVGGSGGGASGERQGGTRWTAWTGKESC